MCYGCFLDGYSQKPEKVPVRPDCRRFTTTQRILSWQTWTPANNIKMLYVLLFSRKCVYNAKRMMRHYNALFKKFLEFPDPLGDGRFARVEITKFLMHAIRHGCTDFIIALIDKMLAVINPHVIGGITPNPDSREGRMKDSLVYDITSNLAYCNQLWMIDHVIRHADPSLLSEVVENAANIAIIQDNLRLLKYMKNCNAEIKRNDRIDYALQYASRHVYKWMVEELGVSVLDEHVPKACGYNRPARQHLELVKYLVSHGADPRVDNSRALRCATAQPVSQEQGKKSMCLIRYLIRCGLDPSSDNCAALNNACFGGYLNVVKYLLRFIELDRNNIEPLKEAIRWNRIETVEYLLHVYGDLSPAVKQEIIVSHPSGMHPEMIECLSKAWNMPISSFPPKRPMGWVDYVLDEESMNADDLVNTPDVSQTDTSRFGFTSFPDIFGSISSLFRYIIGIVWS